MRQATARLLAMLALAPFVSEARPGEKVEVDAWTLGPPEEVLVYHRGRVASDRWIVAGTKDAEAVMGWLRAHQ